MTVQLQHCVPRSTLLSKRQIAMGKKNIFEGSLSSMSLKKSPFTKATLCPEDTGAVEDIQVGISSAGHLPKIVLRVVANAGHAFQSAAVPYRGGLRGKCSFNLNLKLNVIAAFSSGKNI